MGNENSKKETIVVLHCKSRDTDMTFDLKYTGVIPSKPSGSKVKQSFKKLLKDFELTKEQIKSMNDISKNKK